MKFEEYRQFDAIGLADLVARGEVTAAELLELAIARADAVNPQLNGLIIPLYDMARKQATGPLSGPLAGVPMLVKDLFQEIGGAPNYQGNKARKASDVHAQRDSTLVARWKQGGLVPFGRTNTPEFGAKGITEPDSFGPARNPWNPDHTPGGSSGGSAAMVAAGVVPVAGANDGGGSIRIPAACCGLFGLKPGRGRTPWGPEFTEAMHGIAVNHVLTRSVRDSALLLDIAQGDERGSLFQIAPPTQTYAQSAASRPGKLRIGFSTRSPLGTDVDPEAIRAVEKTVALLRDLGHEVVDAEPQMDAKQMCMDWLSVWFGQCAAEVDEVKAITGCGDEGFELDTLAIAAFGRATPAHEYVKCQTRWQQYMIAMDTFLEQYDFWLTPTLAMPPAGIGAMATPPWQQAALKMLLKVGGEKLLMKTGMIEQMAMENFKYMPFTQFANVTGVPAMSVPLHWCDSSPGSTGLPLGSQFVGGHGDEGKLLALAAQLEEAAPWFDKVPM
ncbi:amidase [Alcanivorax sp. VBW004]|uniref:amidase n=1 Tax=Alcanivorax sp. VBW004 TaxID=1287708 RepID=UPI0012BCD242|nr:amidase [Alcanivorax sp. VBW004]MTT51433.1 amidase [Alcanivorax sp. VBW004]